MDHVFVYGTLRSGEANDIQEVARRHRIATPEYVGLSSVTGYLHDCGSYPCLALDDKGSSVVGEVYRIVPELLPFLDEIEEFFPGRKSLFERKETVVNVEGRNVHCYLYIADPRAFEKSPRIVGGDWVRYGKERQ